jgi:hypothetical protein
VLKESLIKFKSIEMHLILIEFDDAKKMHIYTLLKDYDTSKVCKEEHSQNNQCN